MDLKDVFLRVADVFSEPSAIMQLACNGQGRGVVELIAGMDQAAQQKVLRAPGAVSGLAYNGGQAP